MGDPALPNSLPQNGGAHENQWYNQDFDGYSITETPLFTRRKIRIICVGAGAAGLQFAYKAERLLKDVDIQIYEKNSDVGGTWLENRYPGCTCDIPSHSYQYSWARNPNWSHYYSGAKEIWQYFKDVATKYDLEKHVKFNTRVKTARWNEETGQWNLNIATLEGGLEQLGSSFEDYCDILINGTGVLNSWRYPNIPGIDEFQGTLMHSARWNDNVNLEGKRVAIIGGGSSAVQIIPSIQPKAAKLYPFLRSPVWITTGFGAKYAGPKGTNFKYPAEQVNEFKSKPAVYNQYCRDLESELNKRFKLMHLDSSDQKASRDMVAGMMSERMGFDEKLMKLIPEFALGCRRMTPGSGYLESLRAENVEFMNESVVRLTRTGVVGESGVEREVDVVICATGFDTSFCPPYEIHGRNQANLRQQFGDFPIGYLGVMAANFPNMFLFIGPNGPVSHSSILPILEWCTRYAFQCVEKLQTENLHSFEPKKQAVKDYYNHTHELMKRLAWSSACRSWFKNGKEHGPVTAVYAGSRLHWFEMLDKVRWEDFEIKYRTNNRFQFMGNGYTQTEIDPDGNPVWYFDDAFAKV